MMPCQDLAASGGLGYLGELAKNTPSVANIRHYAQIDRNRSPAADVCWFPMREAADQQARACDVQESIEQQLLKPSDRTRSASRVHQPQPATDAGD